MTQISLIALIKGCPRVQNLPEAGKPPTNNMDFRFND